MLDDDDFGPNMDLCAWGAVIELLSEEPALVGTNILQKYLLSLFWLKQSDF